MSLQNCEDGSELIHSQPKNCFLYLGEVSRAFMKKAGGAQVFTGVDAAAFKTDVETEADWDTAISASDPDNIIGTPEITGFDIPEAGERLNEAGYGIQVPQDGLPYIITLTVAGPSAQEELNLRTLSRQAVDFALYSRTHKQLVGHAWETANSDVFFKAYSCFVSNRIANGDGADSILVKLYCRFDAMHKWAAYDTDFLELK